MRTVCSLHPCHAFRSCSLLFLCLGAATAEAQTFSSRNRKHRRRKGPTSRKASATAAPGPAAGACQPQAHSGSRSPQAALNNTPAPYDRDLQRLSEILGALHFLRGICGSNEGQKWRNEAQALIEAEAPAGERHNQMVSSLTAAIALSSRATAPARRRPISPSGVIWTRAPKSPAKSPRATPTDD